jgi:Ser/Thr protein kinase RdoA (MazF antagonist)
MTDSHFPVSYSTLSCAALTTQVLNQYPIGNIQNCQVWARGLSDVYLIETDASRYILRVSHQHWRSGDEIEFEMEFLEFLHQHSIPVAAPHRTINGRLSVLINAPEGDRYATLLSYAPGEIPLGDLSVAQSKQLGEVVAKLHTVSHGFQPRRRRPDLNLAYLLDDSIDLILPYVPQVKAIQELRETRDRLHEQLRHLPQDSPFWTVCWGDPHSGNVHFLPEGGIAPTLFDFDQCGYGWRAFDVAKFLQMALCSGMSYVVRDAFVAGYQGVQPLTTQELTALTGLTQVAHLWRWAISLNDALQHESSRLDNYYFLSRVEQLKMLNTYDWQSFQLVA